MSKKRFYFEIPIDDEASGYEDRFNYVSYGTLIAEGDTLDELLESATVDLVDQDGGEAAIVKADREFLQKIIEDEYNEQVATAGEPSEPEDIPGSDR